ncbi:MAG TPA: ribonuclease activity regulator RraA [Burkholderiales bacterium]|jgi:regulator of RNase E activity RraA|nr:ribonuclease activity regulator RraA [Burkholderiales bacterium]
MKPTPVSPDTLKRLAEVPTATLATQLFKAGFRNTYLAGVTPINPGRRMVGEAATVRFVPAREDLASFDAVATSEYPQRKAIDEIAPGQVLVMDCRGISSVASAGEILMTRIKVRGAAGCVTDGAMRDYAAIQKMDFPVYSRGMAAPAHVHRHLAVDMNVPIGCADVLVMPGDIMVGDDEGVVCVPRHVADKVAQAGLDLEELEAFVLEKIKAGAPLRGTYPPSEAVRAEFEAWKKAKK